MGLALYWLSPVSDIDDKSHNQTADASVEDQFPLPEAEKSEVASESIEPLEAEPTRDPALPSVEIQKKFSESLKNLGECLETQNNVPGTELEPTLQTTIDSIRGEWGEAVITTEDWMQVEMLHADGDKRRIRVEMDFDNEIQVQRKLKYSSIDATGATKPISIPDEQAVEPSEALIASLEAGNQVLTREKFERVYFQNGEEIVAHQVNGYLTSLEVNRGSKSFKCSQMNVESFSCQCVQ